MAFAEAETALASTIDLANGERGHLLPKCRSWSRPGAFNDFSTTYTRVQRLTPLLNDLQTTFLGSKTLDTLPPCHNQSSHFQDRVSGRDCYQSMGTEPTTRKDSLRVEKLSLLVLTLCIVALVYVLVSRPF
jgi:hypothetical protein